jgi:hypothetical protein
MYHVLLDAAEAELRTKVENRKMIILPSTFQGSTRHMNQNYQNAMAIVQKFGRLNLLITFNCNPA